MEFLTVLRKRRSVRSFLDTPIPRQMILDILAAANMAPSATNSQPWSFVVVDREALQRLTELTGEAFNERYGSMQRRDVETKLSRLSIPGQDKFHGLGMFYKTLGGAPVVIIVCVEHHADPYNQMLNLAGASAAVQNLLLAACDRGLGSCWMMGPLQKRNREIKKLLEIGENQDIIAIVPIGYQAAEPSTPKKIAVEEKIRWVV